MKLQNRVLQRDSKDTNLVAVHDLKESFLDLDPLISVQQLNTYIRKGLQLTDTSFNDKETNSTMISNTTMVNYTIFFAKLKYHLVKPTNIYNITGASAYITSILPPIALELLHINKSTRGADGKRKKSAMTNVQGSVRKSSSTRVLSTNSNTNGGIGHGRRRTTKVIIPNSPDDQLNAFIQEVQHIIYILILISKLCSY